MKTYRVWGGETFGAYNMPEPDERARFAPLDDGRMNRNGDVFVPGCFTRDGAATAREICQFCGDVVREKHDPRGSAPRTRCNGKGREHTILDENMRPVQP